MLIFGRSCFWVFVPGTPSALSSVSVAKWRLRSVFSILGSYAQFGHSITGLQIMGLLLVFVALGYNSIKIAMESSMPEKQRILQECVVSRLEADGIPAGSRRSLRGRGAMRLSLFGSTLDFGVLLKQKLCQTDGKVLLRAP
eukprot:s5925_g2.t1